MWMSKKRDVVVGGLLMTLTIKDSRVDNLQIGDYIYGPNDPIAKSFSKDFLDYLAKQNGKIKTNLNNPVFQNDVALAKMMNKQKMILKRGVSKHLRRLFDKDSLVNMKEIASSGLVTKNKDLNRLKEALEKPRGLKGILYKSMKAMIDFKAKDMVEKLKPDEVSLQGFSEKVLYNKEKSTQVQNEPTNDELFQRTMLEFMKMMNETQQSMAQTQKEFFANMSKNQTSSAKEEKNTSEASEVKKPVKSSSSKAQESKTRNQASKDGQKADIQKGTPKSEVDFKSDEIKADILEKWKDARKEFESISDASIKYLNINTVRFNGISLKKLERWKENELKKEGGDLTPEIADSYIQKNLEYADALKRIGILKKVGEKEFEFTDSVKKELLYKNHDSDLPVINKMVNGTSRAKVIKSEVSEVVEYKQKFDSFAKANPTLVTSADIENFNKFYESLNNQDHPKDVLKGELSSYVDGFIKNKENQLSADAQEAQGTDFDPNEGFAKIAQASADMAVGNKNLSSEDVNSEEVQKECDAVIAEALEKDEKEKLEKQQSSDSGPSAT